MHFRNGSGADTVLNFNSNSMIVKSGVFTPSYFGSAEQYDYDLGTNNYDTIIIIQMYADENVEIKVGIAISSTINNRSAFDTAYGSATTTATKPAVSYTSSADGDAVGNGNIQNAIQQLDNAQVDIRNDLLNCKTKYADVDAQYKLIKTERKALKKQVNAIEKRIKEIDKAKEKIRKNML